MKTLQDKVAIVTDAGHGAGRLASLELARAGARLVINESAEEPARLVVEDIQAEGGDALAVIGSATSSTVGNAMVESAMARWGRIDILLLAAAMMRHSGVDFASGPAGELEANVIVRGVENCLQAAAAALRRPPSHGNRKLVVSASVSPQSYAEVKSVVATLVTKLAQEWAPLQLDCNAVLSCTADETPYSHLTVQQQVLNAIAFFCSPGSDGVTGQVTTIGQPPALENADGSNVE